VIKEEPNAKKFKPNRRGPSRKDHELEEILSTEAIEDVVMPFQQLLEDLTTNRKTQTKLASSQKKQEKDRKKKKVEAQCEREEDEEEEDETGSENEEDDDEEDESGNEDEDDEEIEAAAVNTHSQEVLCKDHLDSEESLKSG
jgi:hypothetical protein